MLLLLLQRQEQASRNSNGDGHAQPSSDLSGPHLSYIYKERSIIEDVASLVVHHLKRQASIQKEDKQKMKQLMYQFLPQLFHMPPGELSDDEGAGDDEMETDDGERPKGDREPSIPIQKKIKEEPSTKIKKEKPSSESPTLVNGSPSDSDKESSEGHVSCGGLGCLPSAYPEDTCVLQGDKYNLVFVNNNWYLFLRLHQLLAERLNRIHLQALLIAEEESRCKKERKESTAIALRLKTPSSCLWLLSLSHLTFAGFSLLLMVACLRRSNRARGLLSVLPGYGEESTGWQPRVQRL